MTDLLVITDVPRLRKVFTRLSDDHLIRLRVTSSLEKGGEELVADKPAMVFVQTHLSGLSADILLLHLKKLLGRRRTLFILLSPPDQVGEEVLKLYHGHIDSSLADHPLTNAILDMISELASKKRKKGASRPAGSPASGDSPPSAAATPVNEPPPPPVTVGADPLGRELAGPVVVTPSVEHAEDGAAATLEEQGVVYAPRPQLQVYSEFTSSFDTAVSSMATPDVSGELPPEQAASRNRAPFEPELAERVRPRSKLFSFLLWLVPVVVIVVVITILQYRSIQSPPLDVAAAPPKSAPEKVSAAVGEHPGPNKHAAAPPSSDRKPAAPTSATAPDPRMTDRAVLSAIAENRAVKGPAAAVPTNRPRALPAFIPRTGLDKAYSAANPGWERYKGVVTEFKLFREADSIKAIQVIDRGGQGLPEAFMKGVLQQVAKAPSYTVSSAEKKDGYEIQRGKVADNLGVVYYRDAEGGRLRAFVLTWQ